MTKLKAAPNLKQQPLNATECKIYVGVQAWDFAKLAHTETSTEQIATNQLLGSGEYCPPIVLSEKRVEQSHRLSHCPKVGDVYQPSPSQPQRAARRLSLNTNLLLPCQAHPSGDGGAV